MPKKLTQLKIKSVASVDRGAGEGVKVMLMKRDNSQEPSLNKKDDGIVGKLRTMFLGERVEKAKLALSDSVNEIVDTVGDDENKRIGEIDKSVDKFSEHILEGLEKALATGGVADKKGEDEMSPAIAKALGLADNATEADVIAALAKRDHDFAIAKANMNTQEVEFHNKLPEIEQPAFRALDKAARMTKMEKRDELPESIKKQLAESEDLKKRLATLESASALAEFSKRAVEMGLSETEGVTLQKAYAGDKESVDKLVAYVRSASAVAKSAGAWKEFGAQGNGSTTLTAYDQLMLKAQEVKKIEPKLSDAQAFTKVYDDPKNVDLVIQNQKEESRRIA